MFLRTEPGDIISLSVSPPCLGPVRQDCRTEVFPPEAEMGCCALFTGCNTGEARDTPRGREQVTISLLSPQTGSEARVSACPPDFESLRVRRACNGRWTEQVRDEAVSAARGPLPFSEPDR